MDIKKINVKEELETIKQFWSLRQLAQFNDHVVEIAKLKGAYEMHAHDTDEKIFYIIAGELIIEFEGGKTVSVKAGEFVVIPADQNHKPYAPLETHVILFERKYY